MATLDTQSRDAASEDPAPPAPRVSRLVKHGLDRFLAACALLLAAPLLAAVALALRRRTGCVLRREARVGERGREIVVRSLAVPDELLGSAAWRLAAGSGVAMLPQLWSVVRGELSLVGPRPRAPGHPAPPARPGLTGLAQLRQLERRLTPAEQAALDDEYARTWSLGLDARIAWRTIGGGVVSSGGGRARR